MRWFCEEIWTIIGVNDDASEEQKDIFCRQITEINKWGRRDNNYHGMEQTVEKKEKILKITMEIELLSYA